MSREKNKDSLCIYAHSAEELQLIYIVTVRHISEQDKNYITKKKTKYIFIILIRK